jgi:hypothetical protein
MSRTDEGMKTSAYITETMLDKDWGHANDIRKLPFNKAMNTELTAWEFYELPEQKTRLTRFSNTMQVSHTAVLVLDGLDTVFNLFSVCY